MSKRQAIQRHRRQPGETRAPRPTYVALAEDLGVDDVALVQQRLLVIYMALAVVMIALLVVRAEMDDWTVEAA